MAHIVIELTNRCNLRCRHCFSGRHGKNDELLMGVFEKLLTEAKPNGFNEISFTGGEPSTHRQFSEIMKKTAEAGYTFGFVSNGWNFPKLYKKILHYREQFQGVTFSMDGASESSHDELRGNGSYRRLLSAFSICVAKEIPFAINTVLTKINQHEVDAMVELASAFGSSGIRFGHFIPTGRTESDGLSLSSEERYAVEDRVFRLQTKAAIPVVFAPGYYTRELFACGPLQEDEINVDHEGNVSLCCHLSGYGPSVTNLDVVGSLCSISFREAVARMNVLVDALKHDKIAQHKTGNFTDDDYNPCAYCFKRFKIGEQRMPMSGRVASSK